jgi:hypothetical protein
LLLIGWSEVASGPLADAFSARLSKLRMSSSDPASDYRLEVRLIRNRSMGDTLGVASSTLSDLQKKAQQVADGSASSLQELLIPIRSADSKAPQLLLLCTAAAIVTKDKDTKSEKRKSKRKTMKKEDSERG